MNPASLIAVLFLGIISGPIYSQVMCDTYMDAAPINRTTGYGEEHIAPGFYQALAQRYNNLNGSIAKMKFWARTNPAIGTSNIVKVIVYNEQTGSGLPGVILGQTTITITADTICNEYTATISPPVNLTGTNITIVSIEPFFTSDDFFIRHNKAGDNNTSTPGDGQGLWLNLAKQSNTWYKNLANGDFSWDYDFLILPITNLAVTSNFSSTTNGLTATFTNTSANASSYYWNFGDGNTSSQPSPFHTYSSPGLYDVNLVAFGADTTCADTITKQVAVSLVGLNKNRKEQKKITILNPAKNELVVYSIETDLIFSIYSMLGEQILNGCINREENNIDVSVLKPGIYLIRVDNSQYLKFIKQ